MSRALLSPSGLARHLGSGRVYSVWVWVIAMPFSVAILGGFDDAQSEMQRAQGLCIAVAVHLCIGLLMLSGAAIERAIPNARVRAFAVLAYAAVLGTIRPILIDGAQRLLGVDLFSGNLAARIATNIVFFMIALTLISLLVDTLRQQASARSRLRTVLAVVNASTRDDEAALRSVVQRLHSDAAELIGLALKRERPTQWNAAAEADALRRVSDEIVRPLSHLAFDSARPPHAGSSAGRGDGQGARPSAPASIDEVNRQAQPSPSRAVGAATLSRSDLIELDLRPARVWLAPLLYCLLFLPFLLAHFGLALGIALCATGFAAALLGSTLVALWAPPTVNAPARFIVVVAYACVGMLIASSSFLVLTPREWQWSTVIIHFVGYPTIAITVAACQSAVRQLRASNHALAEALAAADRRSYAARSRLISAREGLARMLHTAVQGELIAVSLQVRTGAADATAVEKALATIQHTLTEHGAGVHTSTPTMNAAVVRESADRLLRSWGSALAIDTEIDPTVWDLLASDKNRASVTLDVVSEALSNVMRHASTPAAQLRLQSAEDNGVSVQVTSLGTLGDSPTTNGYGLADLRARVRDLQLLQLESSVVLRATID